MTSTTSDRCQAEAYDAERRRLFVGRMQELLRHLAALRELTAVVLDDHWGEDEMGAEVYRDMIGLDWAVNACGGLIHDGLHPDCWPPEELAELRQEMREDARHAHH